MLFNAVTTLSILLPVISASAVAKFEKRVTCKDVHLFLARGNGEAYPGRVGAISDTVCSGLPSCDYENILFNSQQSYCGQAGDGVAAGLQQIAAYASSCPKSKLVLAGYSLGAHIVGDILGGGGGNFYGCTEGSSQALTGLGAASHVAAVLMFGDVRHVASEPYNYGPGSPYSGQYPRSGASLANLNQFGPIMRSYCLVQDPICRAGGNDGLSHETYMDVYATDAGYWAQGVLGFAEGGSSTPVTNPDSTSSSVAAPTTSSSSGSSSSSASVSGSSSSADEDTSSGESTSTISGESSSYSTSGTSSSTATDSSSDSSSTASGSSSASTTSSASFSLVTDASTSSDSSSSASVATSTDAPFVFAPQTSTLSIPPLHTTLLSALKQTSTTRTSFSLVQPTTTYSAAAGPASAPAPSSTSTGGAYNNIATGLTLNIVTFVVIKALVF